LSNSAELLAHSGLALGENVTLGRKASSPMSHQVHAVCSPAEADFYQKQGFFLNGRKARNSKRYQTIDPLMGTFRTAATGQSKPTQNSVGAGATLMMMTNNNNNNNNSQSTFLGATSSPILSSSIRKQKDDMDDSMECGNIHRGSNPGSNYPLEIPGGMTMRGKTEAGLEKATVLNDLAMQLHRFKRPNDTGDVDASRGAADQALAGITPNTNPRLSQSSPANSPHCDHLIRPNDALCKNAPSTNLSNNDISCPTSGTDGSGGGECTRASPLIGGGAPRVDFKSAQLPGHTTTTTNPKGVSFV
uniref:Erbb2 interacting protein n=1 Tax=Echinostoma caproni TaxID=27848 RepID=A0A183A598_9TREM